MSTTKTLSWNRSRKIDRYESKTTSKCGRFVITRLQIASHIDVWLKVDGQTVRVYGDSGSDVNFQHIAAAKQAAEKRA